MAFEVGQSVGNYRILRKLGSGGMGEVFLAEHPLIGKSVALKVIHQDLSVNREVVTRFINEAKAVSTVGSEHIVDVHDFGVSAEGAHFFIMEYLEGETLTGHVKRGAMPIELCLHIAAQICSGLAAAHAEGIVHRDLKPDNIMLVEKLGDRSFVKILDFGLAKMLEAGEQLTAMGVVLGTPEFMSPEAAESKGVDGRSDIYSLGVLLFQMLTGRLPFTANSMGEMMVQHVCRPPPVPRAFNPKIPPAVDQIVLRCLAKSKEDRFQSMGDLRAALLNPDAYLSGSPPVQASEGAKSSISSNHPAMARPMAASNRTMSIETPYGYQKAKGGRGLILALVALFSAAGGTAAALVQEPEAAASVSAPEATEATSNVVAKPIDGAADLEQGVPSPSEVDEDAAVDPNVEPAIQPPVEIAPAPSDAGSQVEAVPVEAVPVEPATEPKIEAVTKEKVEGKRPTKKPRTKPKVKKPRKNKVGEDTMAPSF